MLKCVLSLLWIAVAVGCDTTSPPDGRHQGAIVGADNPAEIRTIGDRLNSADPLERAYGARLLGESHQSPDSVLPLLLNALQDPSHLVRVRAAESLGKIGDERAVKPLVEALNRGEEHPDVRASAAEALGQLKAAEAVEPLTDSLASTVWYVRYQAVVALGRIGHPSARDAVTQVVRYDPDFSVRAVAREVLPKLEETAGRARRVPKFRANVPGLRRRVRAGGSDFVS